MKISGYKLDSSDMHIKWQSGENSVFSYFWLRDNARDSVSFDSRSNQRELFTAMVPEDIYPENVKVANNGNVIKIKWPDLDILTEYKSTFLEAYRRPLFSETLPKPKLWDASNLNDDAITIDFINSTSKVGSKDLLQILSTYGFALIVNCPCNKISVTKVANMIGYIRETIFGGLWEFEANATMADSAYTPKELRPHTDSTYSLDAPGLQILLCINYDATGGESIMVDGFEAAQKLKKDDPALYRALSHIDVTGTYRGDGVILEASRPMLRHDNFGRLIQVTFNNYDRSTMRLAEPNMTKLYDGIRYLDRLFNNLDFQWRHQLRPGEMLIFDNWRILHGRGAFVGSRKMAGAYLNREDYLSCLRKHNLL